MFAFKLVVSSQLLSEKTEKKAVIFPNHASNMAFRFERQIAEQSQTLASAAVFLSSAYRVQLLSETDFSIDPESQVCFTPPSGRLQGRAPGDIGRALSPVTSANTPAANKLQYAQ